MGDLAAAGGGWPRLLEELGPAEAARLVLRLASSAAELERESLRVQYEMEREAADLATQEDYLDAAVDALRRQTRRRRRELIRYIERCGPESHEWKDGGGI